MALDLSKLSEAVTAVAGIAQENSQLKAEHAQAQKDVDALTASLIAATTSPAGAAAALAAPAALDPEAVNAAIASLAEKTH